jgi:hypothetical protein
VRVLLSYADGTPALLERRIGSGRVLLWTSTLDLGWTNFPLQSVYMPLMQRITAYLGGETGSAATTGGGLVGQPVTLSIPSGASEPEIRGPEGEMVTAQRGTGTLTFTPMRPGGFSAVPADRPPVAWVAVNTDPAESDVRHTDSIIATQARMAPDRMIRRTSLAFPVLAAGILLLFGASVIGRGRIPDDLAA